MELFDAGRIDDNSALVVLMGDIHAKCKNWDERNFMLDVDRIQNTDNARVILVGDQLQFDLASSVGNVYEQPIPPGEQKYFLAEKLEPIKEKIIGAVSGNHENRSKENGNPTKDLCKFLGIHFFDDEICFRISVGKGKNGKPIVYRFYGVHGVKGGTAGNVLNGIVALAGVADADVYFAAHSHKPVLHHDVYFRADLHNNLMTPVVHYYVGCGSYQGRDSYPVRGAMKPTVMGSPYLKLSGITKDVEASLPRGIMA